MEMISEGDWMDKMSTPMSQRILIGALSAATIAALSGTDATACISRDRLTSIEQARNEKANEVQDVSAAEKAKELAAQQARREEAACGSRRPTAAELAAQQARIEQARRKAEEEAAARRAEEVQRYLDHLERMHALEDEALSTGGRR
jgi:hypothetical protein